MAGGQRGFGVRFARDLPLLGRSGLVLGVFPLAGFFAKLLADRSDLFLPLVPNHVDLGIVGNRLERDMRHPLVNKPHPNIVQHQLGAGRSPRHLGLLDLTLFAIG